MFYDTIAEALAKPAPAPSKTFYVIRRLSSLTPAPFQYIGSINGDRSWTAHRVADALRFTLNAAFTRIAVALAVASHPGVELVRVEETITPGTPVVSADLSTTKPGDYFVLAVKCTSLYKNTALYATPTGVSPLLESAQRFPSEGAAIAGIRPQALQSCDSVVGIRRVSVVDNKVSYTETVVC